MTDSIAFFDGHNDFLLRLMLSETPRETVWLEGNGKGHLDLKRMREAGFAGGLFAIFVPPKRQKGKGAAASVTTPAINAGLPPLLTHEVAQPVALAMAGLLHWMARAAPDDFSVCRSVADIRAAMDAGRIAGVMHMEGAEAIGPELDALYLFHEMGLRSLGPVWSRPTVFGHGVPFRFPATPDTGPGLTAAGKDLVRACNELGVMIDLSHLNEKGFDDVAALSTRPLVATHSNAHALCPSPRNLTDRQLAQIRETGGMVGLNFATIFLSENGGPAADIGWEPMLRHLDYLIEHLGEDNVGLGSDFDGCTVPEVMGDVTGVPKLFEALGTHGYDTALIGKLARENWLGCLERTWGG